MHSVPYAVLISIFPLYSNLIFEGTKKIEFRKKNFSSDIKKIVVYSTLPVGKIEGVWDYDGVEELTPAGLWKKYSKVGGIKKDKYDAYFSNSNIAYGIKVKDPVRFNNPVSIDEIGKKPPQSYVYLTEVEFKMICEKGGM